MVSLLSRKQIVLIVIFTVVETVILTVWLMLLGVTTTISLAAAGVAATVLFVGLLVEHLLAIIAGDFPKKGAVVPQGSQNHA